MANYRGTFQQIDLIFNSTPATGFAERAVGPPVVLLPRSIPIGNRVARIRSISITSDTTGTSWRVWFYRSNSDIGDDTYADSDFVGFVVLTGLTMGAEGTSLYHKHVEFDLPIPMKIDEDPINNLFVVLENTSGIAGANVYLRIIYEKIA